MHTTYQVFVMLLAEKCQYIQGRGDWTKRVLGEIELSTEQSFKEQIICIIDKESKMYSGLVG